MKLWPGGLCLLASAALLTGCATTGSGAAVPTSTSSTIITTTTAANNDQVKALQLEIVAGDLPSGWGETNTDAQAQQQVEDQIDACYKLPPTAQEFEMQIYGDTFTQGTSTKLTSAVSVTKTAQQMQQVTTAKANSQNFSCIENLMSQQITNILNAPGASADSNITPITTLSLKNNQGALRIATDVTVNGQTQTIYEDDLSANDGRYNVQVGVDTEGTAPSNDLDQQLLSAMQNHIVAANSE